MSIIQIQDVQREGAKLLIMLAGVSGGGKTYTAIQLGYGLANGDASKVGFLDTENGRGKLYANILPKPFKYGLLPPPFSPDRYIEAIEQFSRAGVEVLVVDSGSHEYEGIGGIQEIAEAGNPRLPNWNKAKAAHKRFMSYLLSCPMHIILCLRAREKAKPEKQWVDGKEKTVYIDLGLQPITEKNVVFEATASLMLHDQGMRQDVIKCPADLQHLLGRGNGYITAEDGLAIRAWVDGAVALDPAVEHHKGLLQMAAEQGMAALKEAWRKVPPAIKKKIDPKGCPDDLKKSAEAYDKLRTEASASTASVDDASLAGLNAAAAAVASAPAPEPDPAEKPGNQDAVACDPAAGDDGFSF